MAKKSVNNLLEFLDDNEELTIKLTKNGVCTVKSNLEYIGDTIEKLLPLVKAVIGVPVSRDVSTSIPGVDVDGETLALLTKSYEYGLEGLAEEPGYYRYGYDWAEYLYDPAREDEDGNYNPTEEEKIIEYVDEEIMPFAREWSFWYCGNWFDPLNFKYVGHYECDDDETARNIADTLESNYETAMRFFTRYKDRVFNSAEEIQKALDKVDY